MTGTSANRNPKDHQYFSSQAQTIQQPVKELAASFFSFSSHFKGVFKPIVRLLWSETVNELVNLSVSSLCLVRTFTSLVWRVWEQERKHRKKTHRLTHPHPSSMDVLRGGYGSIAQLYGQLFLVATCGNATIFSIDHYYKKSLDRTPRTKQIRLIITLYIMNF